MSCGATAKGAPEYARVFVDTSSEQAMRIRNHPQLLDFSRDFIQAVSNALLPGSSTRSLAETKCRERETWAKILQQSKVEMCWVVMPAYQAYYEGGLLVW